MLDDCINDTVSNTDFTAAVFGTDGVSQYWKLASDSMSAPFVDSHFLLMIDGKLSEDTVMIQIYFEDNNVAEAISAFTKVTKGHRLSSVLCIDKEHGKYAKTNLKLIALY